MFLLVFAPSDDAGGGFLCGGPTACKIWIGAATAATAATGYMAGQAKAFKKTEKAMCENPTAEGCSGSDTSLFVNYGSANSSYNSSNLAGNSNNPGNIVADRPELPPSCADTPILCNKILDIVTNLEDSPAPSSGCSPGDTACLRTESPTMLALSPLEMEIQKQLLTSQNAPPGGWPEGALAGGRDFSLEKLTPEQKREINNLLGGVNKRNSGFVAGLGGGPGDKEGLDSTGFGFPGADSESSPGSDSLGEMAMLSPSNSGFAGGGGALDSLDTDSAGEDSTGSLTGGKGDRYTSSLSDEGADFESDPADLDSTGKKSGLARQTNRMLRDFDSNRARGGKDPFAGKYVDFGSDIVGTIEDNIFMMIHRNHRLLEDRAILP